jgi:cytochrome P450
VTTTDAPVVSLKPLNTEDCRRNPFPFYSELHRLGPVCQVAPGERYDFAVHGYEAVSEVLRDQVFRVPDSTQLTFRPGWDRRRAQAVFMNSMFYTNGARHATMRRMFSQAFTPRRVAGLEPAIHRMASELLDRMADLAAGGNAVDFMTEFAFPFPANVLGELLGVPESDRAWYRPRARALGEVLEFGTSSAEKLLAADSAAEELCDFFADLAERRRAEPRDDLISALVRAQDAEGAPLSEQEFLANLIVLFNAGFVTTTHLLGNGLVLLLDRPEAMARLRAHPELVPNYVEEILRYEGPLHFAVRWAAEDTQIAGVPVPKGSRIVLLSAAANRDPNRFPDPDSFDPDRTDNQSLVFGAGPHFCLGAALARVEGRFGLTTLLDRFPAIRLNRPPGSPSQLTLRGYDELWLELG